MDSLQGFIDAIFGGSISADKIITIVVAIYAVIKSFTEWRATKKLINSQRTLSGVEQELIEERKENKQLKESVSALADIVVTAYLSSNTISSDTKKELVTISNKLKENAGIDLSTPAVKLVEAVENGLNVDLGTVKQELKEKTEALSETLDIANEVTQNAIDKLTV